MNCSPSEQARPTPRFSVLLASRNEGFLLRKTVHSICTCSPPGEYEIIVVDDASEDGSADFLGDTAYSRQPVRAVRNEVHSGLVYSRARAADLARGHYFAFLDAHCRVSAGWLEGLAEELGRIDEQGLAVPLIYKLDPESWTIQPDSEAAGACTLSSPFLDFSWTDPRELEGRLCTCTIGGGAWMCSREWYRHIGGLDRGMVVWGGENIDVPLRTWAAGGWCVLAENVSVGHVYKEGPTYVMSDADFAYNKIRAAHNAFSAETFTRVMESLMYASGFREAFTRIHGEREALGRFKDSFEAVRKRPDSWFIDAFRLPVFEDPLYHLAPRRLAEDENRPLRPFVSVIVPIPEGEDCPEPLVASVLEKTAYGNYEILLVSSGDRSEARSLLEREPYRGHRRLRAVSSTTPLGGGLAENVGASATEAEYLVFLPARSIVTDEHWLEKFLLLAEKRPRLLVACPRTRWIPAGGSPGEYEGEWFDAEWDWEAPGCLKERVGPAPHDVPYQAFSCPDTLLFVDRERFLSLGGFDCTVRAGARPVLDLTVKGWLAGYEMFCHPDVTVVRRRASAPRGEDRGQPGADRWRDYAQLLAAEKCFTSSSRLSRCRAGSPHAGPLIGKHARHVAKSRREFLSRARFDDDWLFFKFGIEDSE
jgi:glycosyltransferase involved in cell wall biosynthesis